MKMIVFLTGIIAAAILSGCKQTDIQVIENNNVITNNVELKAFQHETYIWESWLFSTNTVNKSLNN